MNILINYADGCCQHSRRKNSITGLEFGFDNVIEWKRKHIHPKFIDKFSTIMNSKRGAGYWLWKPYIIHETMDRCEKDDIIFYSDAASYFMKDMTPIISEIDRNNVICFELAGKHKEGVWTRRNVMERIGFSPNDIKDTDQRMASFIGVKNNEEARKIMDLYLKYACQQEMIMDFPKTEGYDLPEFKEHRHDQSIWSLITKKNKVTILPDPTQWGQQHGQSEPGDHYIMHTRDKS